MANQTDVQKLIQSLVPSAVNNGNPNTVYNTAPPTLDAAGTLYTPNLPSAASVTALQRAGVALPASQGWQAPVGGGGANLPKPVLPAFTGNPGWVPMTPPANTGGGGGGSGGGIGGNPTPNLPRQPTQVQNSPGWDRVEQGSLSPGTGSYLQPGFTWTGGGYTRGPVSFGSGSGSGGSMDWNQLADVGLDALGLKGDFYHSGTGKWDASNIIAGLIKTATGLPVNSFMSWLGELGIKNGWSDKNIFVDHVVDQIRNRLDSWQKDYNKLSEKQRAAFLEQSINSILASKGLYGSPTRADMIADAARSTTPIQGMARYGVSPYQMNPILNQFNPNATKLAPKSVAALGAGGAVVEGAAARAMFESMQKADIGKNYQSGRGVSIFGGNGTYKK